MWTKNEKWLLNLAFEANSFRKLHFFSYSSPEPAGTVCDFDLPTTSFFVSVQIY